MNLNRAHLVAYLGLIWGPFCKVSWVYTFTNRLYGTNPDGIPLRTPTTGLVAGPLIVRFGTRKVAVTGSLSAFVGIFLSSFAFNIVWLYIFYGAFTGKLFVGLDILVVLNYFPK